MPRADTEDSEAGNGVGAAVPARFDARSPRDTGEEPGGGPAAAARDSRPFPPPPRAAEARWTAPEIPVAAAAIPEPEPALEPEPAPEPEPDPEVSNWRAELLRRPEARLVDALAPQAPALSEPLPEAPLDQISAVPATAPSETADEAFEPTVLELAATIEDSPPPSDASETAAAPGVAPAPDDNLEVSNDFFAPEPDGPEPFQPAWTVPDTEIGFLEPAATAEFEEAPEIQLARTEGPASADPPQAPTNLAPEAQSPEQTTPEPPHVAAEGRPSPVQADLAEEPMRSGPPVEQRAAEVAAWLGRPVLNLAVPGSALAWGSQVEAERGSSAPASGRSEPAAGGSEIGPGHSDAAPGGSAGEAYLPAATVGFEDESPPSETDPAPADDIAIAAPPEPEPAERPATSPEELESHSAAEPAADPKPEGSDDVVWMLAPRYVEPTEGAAPERFPTLDPTVLAGAVGETATMPDLSLDPVEFTEPAHEEIAATDFAGAGAQESVGGNLGSGIEDSGEFGWEGPESGAVSELEGGSVWPVEPAEPDLPPAPEPSGFDTELDGDSASRAGYFGETEDDSPAPNSRFAEIAETPLASASLRPDHDNPTAEFEEVADATAEAEPDTFELQADIPDAGRVPGGAAETDEMSETEGAPRVAAGVTRIPHEGLGARLSRFAGRFRSRRASGQAARRVPNLAHPGSQAAQRSADPPDALAARHDDGEAGEADDPDPASPPEPQAFAAEPVPEPEALRYAEIEPQPEPQAFAAEPVPEPETLHYAEIEPEPEPDALAAEPVREPAALQDAEIEAEMEPEALMQHPPRPDLVGFEPNRASRRTAVPAPPVPASSPEGRGRRLYRRVVLEAEIEIDGVPCRLLDLSVGGFGVADVPAHLASETVAPVRLRIAIDGIELGATMRANIVYSDEARAAGRFVELTPSQTALLRYLVTWNEESLGRAGTTALLDAITRRPERARIPDQGRRIAPPAQRAGWWARWFGARGA